MLARCLRDALGSGSISSSRPAAGAVPAALRDYERQRTRRAFPIAARSWVFGALLQIPLPPVRHSPQGRRISLGMLWPVRDVHCQRCLDRSRTPRQQMMMQLLASPHC